MERAEEVQPAGARVSAADPSRLERAASRLWQGVFAPLRGVVDIWQRSIQARVVISVLSLSTVVVFLAGWLLLSQVTHGLLETKRQSALTQASQGFDTAQGRLNRSTVSGGDDIGVILRRLVVELAPRDQANNDYIVAVIGPLPTIDPDRPDTWATRHSGVLDVASSVPRDIVARIRSSSGSYWAYTGMHQTAAEPPEPALVVASGVNRTNPTRSYGLLYVFPLADQQQTLSVVERGMLVSGGALVVLLSTIAWLVTRQVVTPVRFARRIAERLASGRLEERMHVRGKDDIARLGQSFNQMATGLQRQIRQLEELSRVQRRFVADVSHELRTPLTTVRMASDLLYEARRDFDAPTARSAELLQAELDRFEGLLTDLLEISRFDAGAAALELSDLDLRTVVSGVVEATDAIAHQRGSSVTLSLPSSPAVVQADVRRVQRIVRNLVVNALHYGEAGDVDIAVTPTTDWVSVTVRDHGVGLQPDEQVLVFSRFWRADPARDRTTGGTGLGLSIAVEDTRLHGGVLDVVGQPGLGSVFRLVLPRRIGRPVHPDPLVLNDESLTLVGAPYARIDVPEGGGTR